MNADTELTKALRSIIADEVSKQLACMHASKDTAERGEQGEERILFVDETAERLRRSPASLRWMITEGTAPKHAKIAGRICFRESDVNAWIAAAFEGES